MSGATKVQLLLLLRFWVALSQSYVTPDFGDDGMGAQTQRKISCIMMARVTNQFEYVHTPFKNVQHAVDARRAEQFFNLGEGEIPVFRVPQHQVQHISDCNEFADKHPWLYSVMRPTFRTKYFSSAASSKITPKEFRLDAVNVAVHMRQGDAHCYEATHLDPASRCIPNNVTADMMIQLAELLYSHKIQQPMNFQLYSEGDLEGGGFETLHDRGHTFGVHLDGDPLETFNAFVDADVLILGHSSYSYLAGLYTDNIVVYSKFWHEKLPAWLEYQHGIIVTPLEPRHTVQIEALSGRIAERQDNSTDSGGSQVA